MSLNDELNIAVNLSPNEKTVSIPLLESSRPKCVFSSLGISESDDIKIRINEIDNYMDVTLPPYTAKIIKQNKEQIKITI